MMLRKGLRPLREARSHFLSQSQYRQGHTKPLAWNRGFPRSRPTEGDQQNLVNRQRRAHGARASDESVNTPCSGNSRTANARPSRGKEGGTNFPSDAAAKLDERAPLAGRGTSARLVCDALGCNSCCQPRRASAKASPVQAIVSIRRSPKARSGPCKPASVSVARRLARRFGSPAHPPDFS